MACSSFLSRQMNKQPLEADNNNYLSRNLIRLGNKFKDGKRNTLPSQDADIIQLRNKPENEIFLNEMKEVNSHKKSRRRKKSNNLCLKNSVSQTKPPTIEEEVEDNFYIHKQIISEIFYEPNDQVRATEKVVSNTSSTQDAAPFRMYKHIVNMSNNLQGETIPMACPNLLLIILNKTPTEWDNKNYLSSNFYLLEEMFKNIRRNELPTQAAEPNQLMKKFGVKFLEMFLEKFYQKRKIHQEKEAEKYQARIVNQKRELELLVVNLIVEVFMLFKKPEFIPQNSSFRIGERSDLKSIGNIFIALKLHRTNGYCISSSSSDDG
jgi:hypothetical protein